MKQQMTSALCGFGGAALALGIAQATGVTDAKPRAEQLVLRGAGGSRVVVGFQSDADTQPGLWVYDGDGRLRAELSYDPHNEDSGDETKLVLFDATSPAVEMRDNGNYTHGRESGFYVHGLEDQPPVVRLGSGFGMTMGPNLIMQTGEEGAYVSLGTDFDCKHPELRMSGPEMSMLMKLERGDPLLYFGRGGHGNVHVLLPEEGGPYIEVSQPGEASVRWPAQK